MTPYQAHLRDSKVVNNKNAEDLFDKFADKLRGEKIAQERDKGGSGTLDMELVHDIFRIYEVSTISYPTEIRWCQHCSKTIINTIFLSHFLPFSENYAFLCFPHVIFHFLRSPNGQPVKSRNQMVFPLLVCVKTPFSNRWK